MPAQEISPAEVEAARLYPIVVGASPLYQRVTEVARALHARGHISVAGLVYGDAEVLRDAGAGIGGGMSGLRDRLITLADVTLGLARVIREYGLETAEPWAEGCACGHPEWSPYRHSPLKCHRVVGV